MKTKAAPAVLSYEAVAKILGCSRQAVQQCERRALKKLRARLGRGR